MHGTSAEMTGNDCNVPHAPRPRLIAPEIMCSIPFLGQCGTKRETEWIKNHTTKKFTVRSKKQKTIRVVSSIVFWVKNEGKSIVETVTSSSKIIQFSQFNFYTSREILWYYIQLQFTCQYRKIAIDLCSHSLSRNVLSKWKRCSLNRTQLSICF